MVKKIIYFLFVILSISILCFAVSMFPQEITRVPERRSDKEMEKKWKDQLRKYPLSKQAVELERQCSFPAENLVEKEIFLWRPVEISISQAGSIFVMDQKWSQIFIFDFAGNYLNKFGRKGAGPAEFNLPVCQCVAGDFVFVIDNGNSNIQKYDLSGNFIGSKKTFRSYIDITADSSGQIYAVPLRSTLDAFHVDVFDGDGSYLRSIIKPDQKMPISWDLASMIHVDVNSSDEIILAYACYPRVTKYRRDGELIKQWNLEDGAMKERAKINVDRSSGVRKDKSFTIVIYDVRASSKGGFYLLTDYPRTRILEYDKNGRLIHEYWYNSSWDYLARHFIVSEQMSQFFLMQTIPDKKIDVYRPKNIVIKK